MKFKKAYFKIGLVSVALLLLLAAFDALPFSITGVTRISGEWNEYKGEMLKVKYSLSGVSTKVVLVLPKDSELKLSDTKKVVTLKEVEIEWQVLEPYSTIGIDRTTYDLGYSVDKWGKLETTQNEYKVFRTSWLTTTRFSISLRSDDKLIQEPIEYKVGFGEQFTDKVIGSGDNRAEIESLGWLSMGVGDIATDFIVVLDPAGKSRIFKKTEFDAKVEKWNLMVNICVFPWTELSYSDFWHGRSAGFTTCEGWKGIGDLRDYTLNLGSDTVTRVEISDSYVRVYRPSGAYTSEVVMWLTGSLAGAEVREIRMDAIVGDIVTVPSSIRVKEGTTAQMDVVVSNIGYGGGNIDVTLQSNSVAFIPSSTTLYVAKGSSNSFITKIIPEPVDKDTSCDITIKAIAAGGSKVKVVPCTIEDVKDKLITTPPIPPTSVVGEVSITKVGITFKGDDIYSGRILAIGLETDTEMSAALKQVKSLLTQGDVEWVYSPPLSPYTKFNLINTKGDEDRFTYSLLLEADIYSTKPTNYYLNGKIEEQGVKEFHYSNPVKYLPFLILIAVVGVGYLLLKKR